MEFSHVSVLPTETTAGLVTNPDGVYVDCTLGGAGHSLLIAEKLSERGRIIGIDRDDDAITAAKMRLENVRCRVDIFKDNFKNLASVLKKAEVNEVDGILLDLGVSSHQLDTAERGFSYMQDAPLDMRMDATADFSAYDVVNTYSADGLTKVFREYGEERWAKRIAEFIEKAREEQPIKTTGELVEIIKKAIPKAVRMETSGHPAKRIFQAIRIEVNDELNILADTFKTAVAHLKPGGRIAVITFHSLEDRIAKNVFREMASGCICPPSLPVCVCNHKPEIKLLVKGATATKDELSNNSRAKSAKLRIAEKL